MRGAKTQSNGNSLPAGSTNKTPRAELSRRLDRLALGSANAADLGHGRPLGSFEQWSEWCRDPLLALGCRDPIDRIDEIKSDDPYRRQIVELFEAWDVHHGPRPVKAAALAEPVRASLDPQRHGRQYIAARLMQLTGTRAGGYVLTRQEAAGKWGASTYSLRRK